MTQFQAQLWSVHMGIKEAFSRGFNNLCIEIEHVGSFRILKRQNYEEALNKGLVEVLQDINACDPLMPDDYEPICRIYPILETRNPVARHVAYYGLFNCEGVVQIDQ